MSTALDRAGIARAGEPAEAGSWTLVWTLAAAQLVSWGALYYSFSLFVVPMEQELGWSRTAINGALSCGLLAMGVSAYPVGAWIDRHGGRWLMTLGSLLAVALLAAWSTVESIAAFYALIIALGVAMAATLYEPAFVVLTRLFAQTYRTRITAMTLVGGFASTVFIPLIQVLIGAFGWRQTLLILALTVAAICVPVHAFVLRDGAASRGPSPAGESPVLGRDAVRRAMRTPVFWGLCVCFTAYYATFSVLTFHIIPLLTDRAVPPEIIVGAIATIGPAQVAGRIVLLALGRRLRTATVGRIIVLMFPASVLLLIFLPHSIAALFVFAAIYGAANGVMTIVRGTAIPDLLWREGYGAINGALAAPATVAKAAAPFAAAVIWSLSGGYDAVLWTVFAGGLIAVAGFWFASRPQAR